MSMDIYGDSGAHLKSRIPDQDVPDFVKSAAAFDSSDLPGLPDECFAYVNGKDRAYLTVDSGHTFTSALYFLDSLQDGAGLDRVPESHLQKVAQNLQKACRDFDLTVPAMLTKVAKLGLPEDVRPVKVASTQDNLERSVSFFAEKYSDYTPPRRREIGCDLVKTASDMGVNVEELPDAVRRYGSNAWNPELSNHLEQRRQLVKKAGRTDLVSAVNELEKVAFSCDIDEFAATLYEFDKEAGIEPQYDERVTDAWLATFGEPVLSDDGTTEFVDDMRKFAETEFAKETFSQDLLEKIAENPVDFCNNHPVEFQREAVLAAFGSFREQMSSQEE